MPISRRGLIGASVAILGGMASQVRACGRRRSYHCGPTWSVCDSQGVQMGPMQNGFSGEMSPQQMQMEALVASRMPGRSMAIGSPGVEDIGEPTSLNGRQAFAIHIGVDWTNPSYYGSTNNLNACVRDANDLRSITRSYQIGSTLLTNSFATSERIIRELKRAATKLNGGDLVVMSYSGHGAQVPDESGDESAGGDFLSVDKAAMNPNDEALVLHDRLLIDDELAVQFSSFKEGVRILVIFDSCHSGTATRSVEGAVQRSMAAAESSSYRGPKTLDGPASDIAAHIFFNASGQNRGPLRDDIEVPRLYRAAKNGFPVFRVLPRQYNFDLYVRHEAQLKQIQKDNDPSKHPIKATSLLLAACHDSQLAREELFNGLFTFGLKSALRPVLGNSTTPAYFNGSYQLLLDAARLAMGAPAQTPTLFAYGKENVPFLKTDKPFYV